MSKADNHDRMLELLADQATEGLEAVDAKELDMLLARHPDYDGHALERAAAALNLAMASPLDESLPGQVRDRILNDAHRFFETSQERTSADSADSEPKTIKFDRARQRSGGRVGWYVAAASIVLAVFGWWQALSIERGTSPAGPGLYASFVEETPDLLRAPWSGKEPGFQKVSGDVVWSDTEQNGFMRLVNLPPNDPKLSQYQLWIVDPGRDKHPIDGGVFDVQAAGEVIVQIDPKLRVDNPTVFAITLEKPGGVVVSGGPLLVVGAVAG